MRAVALAALSLFVISPCNVLAKGAQTQTRQATASTTADAKESVLLIPAPKSRRSLWAKAERVKTVNIPQWAKDEGHNGRALYSATVGEDGQLIELELIQSSMSLAIDEAVKARAQTLKYEPATDNEGNPVEGKVNVWME